MPPNPKQEDDLSASDVPSDYESKDFDGDDPATFQDSDVKLQVHEKDVDEEELERLVLGDRANFRANLFSNDLFGEDTSTGKDLQLAGSEPAPASGAEALDDSALFFFATDREPAAGGAQLASTRAKTSQDPTAEGHAPAWEDSDDENLSVSLASVGRLRKLRLTEGEDVVSGAEYTRRLRQQYLRLHPQPLWVKDAAAVREHRGKRRRRSSAAALSTTSSDGASGDDDGDDDNDDEDYVSGALPLDDFLRDASVLTESGSRKRRKLRPEVINIQKTRDIPDTHKGPVESLSFHPRYPVLLSASTSSMLHLHHVAPAAYPRPNPLLTSVQVKGTPIRRAEFLRPEGARIVFAGRRRFFHSWDLSTGAVVKVSKVQGHRLEQRTVERFRTSPCGRHMAVIATDRKGGGMLNVVRVGTMQWMAQARLDGRGGIADFCWWGTGEGITILGRDGGVGEWSLEARRFVGLWRDSGSTGGTVLAMGGSGQGPEEIGGDRWVAVGSNTGILQVYERQGLVLPRSASKGEEEGEQPPGGLEAEDEGIVALAAATVSINPHPEPTRVFESLTTPITAVTISPDSQLLAFASRHKKDAFRLAHLPSCTLFRNWPTAETPFGRVTAVAFGRAGDMLAVGNDNGKVRLWEIRA